MSRFGSNCDFSIMVGETIASIDGCSEGSELVRITTASGRSFVMDHQQDCCEHVSVAQVDGDPQDLVGHEITMAEEISDADGPPPKCPESYTWTFYKMGCLGGYLTIRWLGESNGYYGEEVNFNEE